MRQLTKILLALSLAFSLSACGYGSVPETAQMGPVGSGADAVVGEMKIQETLVISDGVDAVLTAVLINTGDEPETLLGASVDNHLVDLVDTSTGLPVKMSQLVIPANSSVSLSFNAPYGAALDNKDVALPEIGSAVKFDFAFARNGFVKYDGLVFANEDIYSSVSPAAFAITN